MIYYPVLIPTLNRYEHLKRCVESLAKNTHADKTELVIGLDYPPSDKYREGYEKVKTYVYTITGFAKVTIFEREKNYGPVKNYTALKEYVFQNFDAAISSEDDNEFSPCFLDFMDKILEKYKDDDMFTSVSGYLHPDYIGVSSKKVILTKETNAWGMGHWKTKEMNIFSTNHFKEVLTSISKSWKCFKAFPASFSMLIEMVKKEADWGDVRRTNTNILNGTYQIRPNISLCKNWGYDGSGLHCGIDKSNKFNNQTKSEDFVYDIGTEKPQIDSRIFKVTSNLLLPQNPLKRVKFFVRVGLNYLQFRYMIIRYKK